MVDPGLALVTFGLITVVAALALWPGRGGVARLMRLARLTARVRLEDALKHAYVSERRGQVTTLESLAGGVGISTGRAATLLSELTDLGLMRPAERGPALTEAGRESAVRIIRTHRLWERYLADRTGLPAQEWHDEAERMEHALSLEEVEHLSERLGHPAYDPHGDPIPTASGDLPPFRGGSLASAVAGRTVEVAHLEDEPSEVYRTLLDAGLAPGQRLEVLEVKPTAIRVRSGTIERSLDTVAARNVTVLPLPGGAEAEHELATLAQVPDGETVRVVSISPTCQGTQRRRLLDLGVVRGAEITPELVSASGDPVAYRIRGALIALRAEQARWISVESAAREEGAA